MKMLDSTFRSGHLCGYVGGFHQDQCGSVTLLLGAGGAFAPASAEPVAREADAVASVIARKTGEEVRFIDVSNWRFVDLQQDLLTGDVLRTNATGQLAILFADRTQIRLGRNSSLRVRQMKPGSDAVLELEAGTIWARAERGGPGVEVVTPAATAAIRGTDWTMTVKGAETSLTVLEGLVELSNPQGSVQVAQGEAAAATIGQAPRKIVIVDSDDREQMLFYLAPRNAFNFMPASPLPVADMRREADRIADLPAEERSTADLLVLAEVQLSLEGREDAKQTLAMLRARKLSPGERARADPSRRSSPPPSCVMREATGFSALPVPISMGAAAKSRLTAATTPGRWPIRTGWSLCRAGRRAPMGRCWRLMPPASSRISVRRSTS
jgi:hypothetical protein